MSASSQNNGRSSNSSVVNTPASTPITTISNTQVINSQNSPPPNNNAPKYGTLVPNRIFVGGISANTTEGELLQLFSNYGTVKAAKIIQDRAGVSKGYGFITFESEDDARRPLREAENIVLRERKLNIAPAIKKQPFSRAFDASSPPTVAAGNPQFFFPPGTAVPYFQGGVAYYPQPTQGTPGDPNSQQPVYQPAPPVYPAQTGPQQTATYPPMMFPAQTFYMPQQYSVPMPYDYNYYQNNGAPPQYMVSGQGGPGPQCPPMPPSNSPPRPPCYNQQMPYTPTDPMFYNMSLYGATMEGTPIYSEGFDIATGPYSEDSYNLVDAPSQDLAAVVNEHQSSPRLPCNDGNETTQITTTTPTQPQILENSQCDVARKTTTPVVSLLAIEQQQEKDYLSMQGGRRRKSNPMPQQLQLQQSAPQPPPQQQNTFQPPPPNGYINYSINYNPGIPTGNLYPYNGIPTNFNGPIPHEVYRYGGGVNNRQMTNGYDRSKKRRNFNERRSNDHSSRSSLRTDSNSSASAVDENKNEEKTLRTNVNTPPPAPYSPITNHGSYYKVTNNLSRNYHNSMRQPATRSFVNNNNNNVGCENSRREPVGNSNKSGAAKVGQSQVQTVNKRATDFGALHSDFYSSKNSNNFHGLQQVHGNQSFMPPVRRSRKSIRRTAPGGAVSEIGAGDAPLPNAEVQDACKKMESLKL